MKKYNNTKERVPFYYRYFGRLVDAGVEKVHSKDVASELGFKSANSIVRDFNLFIENAGNIKYGYNNTFMYNKFKDLMDIGIGVNVAVVGESLPLFNNAECSRRGFHIVGTLDKIDTELIEAHEIQALILTNKDALADFGKIPDIVKVIINFTGKEIDDAGMGFYVVNIDILELLSNAWYLKGKKE
ncbi:MAG: hypothetical protein J6I68_11570 [Butyrivibrio sp.]|uniref:winged-helix domain-containing protein n=1 Tax=Butyrivibrio sp. TaxID=28121 RepID=UPI001B569593|nr:winged-helix domain-containing protein [Butyrivibrio sp.]MBP3783875.1 hypothetical protein [Butyrivibrio sp.]